MRFGDKSFSVRSAGRSPAVCEANGGHAEPDNRGRCFMCGVRIAEPPLVINRVAVPFPRAVAEPEQDR